MRILDPLPWSVTCRVNCTWMTSAISSLMKCRGGYQSVIVKVTFVPTSGVALSTVLVSERSAIAVGVVVAVS